MARLCKQCGEKLFPTDTFCGFCGATVENVAGAMADFDFSPRSLVGEDALTQREREQIEYAKRKYMTEAAAPVSPKTNSAKKESTDNEIHVSSDVMRAKREQLMAAKHEADTVKLERQEAERLAEEEAARKREEAERIEAEEAVRKELERQEAERLAEEEAARKREEAERIEAEEAVRKELERQEAERLAEEEAVRKREEAERIEAEEAVRKELERQEAERLAEEEAARKREEAERIEAEEAVRKELERQEAERLAEEEAARKREEAERIEVEEAVRKELERQEAERLAEEEAEREFERQEIEETDKYSDKELIERGLSEIEQTFRKESVDSECVSGDELSKGQDTEAIPGQPSEEEMLSVLDSVLDSSDEPDEMTRIWEEAEKRARAEQREADRQKRKARLHEKPKHLTRDIVLLSIGIVVLVLVLVLLVQSELKGLKGNDSNYKNEPTPAATPEAQKPSDMGMPWDGSVATDFDGGDGTLNNPYRIMCGSQLAYLATEVNRGVNFADTYFSLGADIDLGGREWTPIGYYYADETQGDLVYSFNGTFMGSQHKILNFKISALEQAKLLPNYSDNKVLGLFGTTNGASIADLTVENCIIEINETGEGEILAGSLVGCSYSTGFANCKVTAEIKVDSQNRSAVGLCVGAMSEGSMSDVSANGTVAVTTAVGVNDSGLISGYTKMVKFKGIKAEGNVTAKSSGALYAGGISGYSMDCSYETIEAAPQLIAEGGNAEESVFVGGVSGLISGSTDKGVSVTGTISTTGVGEMCVGGSYGYVSKTGSENHTIDTEIIVSGTTVDKKIMVGGVYGFVSESTLSGGTVGGSINGTAVKTIYCGGVIGQGYKDKISGVNTDAAVSGTATDKESAIVMCGGISGNIELTDIADVTAGGNVTVNSQYDGHAGGISGYINGGNYTNAVASGIITNTSTVGVSSGGFAGYAAGEYVTESCTGTVNRINKGANVYDDDFIAIIAEGDADGTDE